MFGSVIQRFFDIQKAKAEIEMLKINHVQTLELARLESERATHVAGIEANASVRRADMAQMTHEIII